MMSGIPDKHSAVASWYLVKASSTIGRHLLATTPARCSQYFPPPSFKPAMLGENLPHRNCLEVSPAQPSAFTGHGYLEYVPWLYSAPTGPADFWLITSVLVSSDTHNKIP